MTPNDAPHDPTQGNDDRLRLSQLLQPNNRERARLKLTGQRRVFILRWVRLSLPLAALAIVAIVMAWPQMETNITPIPKEDVLPANVGRNELINPRFESEDSQAQPYNVTADSATQDNTDPNLIIMQKPKAELKLNSGEWLAGEADTGHYQQENKTLALRGQVRLFQNTTTTTNAQPYIMHTDMLDIDMNTRRAQTTSAVSGQGPAGTIRATGMIADANAGTLIFTGPATLTLNDSIKGLSQ